MIKALVGLLLAELSISNGFYLPGVAPHSYYAGETVELKVNKLSSVHTQLPFNYYSLKYCRPAGGIIPYSENLGEFLTGDRIENSPYEITMLEDVYCKVLCQQTLKNDHAESFRKSVQHFYHNNWIIDNLPSASILDSDHFITTEYIGFPVGYKYGKDSFLYNHVNIILEYSKVAEDEYRIVGFYVEPLSIEHRFTGGRIWDGVGEAPPLSTCDAFEHTEYIAERASQRIVSGASILYTYDVEWRESSVQWASRWDVYLSNNNSENSKVHWFSIINSIIIVVFLAFMIAMILIRALNKDISRYNRVPQEDFDKDSSPMNEDYGWKLIHADVFRPPSTYPMLYCVIVGTGVQLYICILASILFAAIGFLSPTNRGSIMITLLMIFVLCGSLAGYVSARLYKTFKGKEWQKCTLITAFFYPSIMCGVFLVVDIVLWRFHSTSAIPILTMLSILVLWFGISTPLVFIGAYAGYKTEVITFPVVTSNIPRQVPDTPWYLESTMTVLLGGILPFGACFVEMFFIMSSIWMDQYYYIFGFLLLSFIILTVTCIEISVIYTYLLLNSENYHWWWGCMVTSGSTALYVFFYSCLYFAKLESNMYITYMIYFIYMSLISFTVAIVTATIGFFSSLFFNYHIYSCIKVD